MVVWDWETWGSWKVMTRRYKVSLWSDENVLKLIMMMVAQLCEYMKSH